MPNQEQCQQRPTYESTEVQHTSDSLRMFTDSTSELNETSTATSRATTSSLLPDSNYFSEEELPIYKNNFRITL